MSHRPFLFSTCQFTHCCPPALFLDEHSSTAISISIPCPCMHPRAMKILAVRPHGPCVCVCLVAGAALLRRGWLPAERPRHRRRWAVRERKRRHRRHRRAVRAPSTCTFSVAAIAAVMHRAQLAQHNIKPYTWPSSAHTHACNTSGRVRACNETGICTRRCRSVCMQHEATR